MTTAPARRIRRIDSSFLEGSRVYAGARESASHESCYEMLVPVSGGGGGRKPPEWRKEEK
jgi:hypothetical protein